MTQFFYKEGSFNVSKVIRTLYMEDGKLLVLLDDLHERAVETPTINPKTNKVTGVSRKRDTYQSEIYLEGDDIARFKKATNMETIWEVLDKNNEEDEDATV